MPERDGPAELRVLTDDGVELAGQQAGVSTGSTAIVLLHGLTATRRYVVMGSRTLEREGYRVVSYDARGHGRSTPASDPVDYGYARLARDLQAVLDALEFERAVLAGASMGAHTAVRFALRHPERVAALGLITPSFDPDLPLGASALAAWDTLADGLREGGVEGFVAAYDFSGLPRTSIPRRWPTRSKSCRARDRSSPSPSSTPSTYLRLSSPAATRRIPATRWRWENVTRGRSRTPGSSSRTRDRHRARRSPGREDSCRRS